MTSQSRYAGAEFGAGVGPEPPVPARDIGGGVRAASLLDLLPELGERLAPSEWSAARARSLVQVETFPEGLWTPRLTRRDGRADTALLIARGLLIREVQIAGRISAELLGDGDLIYPWAPRSEASLPEGKWRALTAGYLAVVDELLVARIAPYPSVTASLARLSTLRGRFLAALTITRRLRRVEDRLTFLFALLCERWGRVTPDGVALRLPLRHEALGQLVGARRQAVTTALGGLRRRGLVLPLPDGGWLLTTDPAPDQMLADSGRLARVP
jgi:hypothetical protein